MKILRADKTDLPAALDELSSALGFFQAGMTAAGADERTEAVFGEALSPLEAVRRILSDVRELGDGAVAAYAEKLDGARLTPDRFRVSPEEIVAACDAVPDALKKSLSKAKENIRRFQEHIKIHTPSPLENAEGGTLTVRYLPLNRVAVYVPGGSAGYPSTVLMAAVPAQVAGVKEVAMITPCGRDGAVRPETLAAAHEAGITEIYRGAAVALIGAAAYGTATIPRVDKIVGPGNLFVTLAKREVYGQVDLDMLAGPSEVLIIADGAANPRFLAADLLSQAEHNPASAVLLTPNAAVAERTVTEIERQAKELSRGVEALDCIERYGFVAVTCDLDQAVELANRFAPEHLELAVADPEALVGRLRNAGAIFVGPFTPEPVGDYIAGPSHVLPTGGTARFFSGLSVNDFLRRTSVLAYSRDALQKVAADVDVIARAEGLDAHARAATIRFEESERDAQEP